jgi:hypothetical protein
MKMVSVFVLFVFIFWEWIFRVRRLEKEILTGKLLYGQENRGAKSRVEIDFVGERIWKKGSTKPSIKRNCRNIYPI